MRCGVAGGGEEEGAGGGERRMERYFDNEV
jgi:hypothetical protein